MAKFTREELMELIRKELHEVVYETLREKSQEQKDDERNRTFKPKGLSEEELEYALFHGGNKPEEKNNSRIITTTIKEGYDNGFPKINASDITGFEDGLEEMMKEVDGASVVFDKQSNGYSLTVGISPQDGIEAAASGNIDMGAQGKVEWAYSLKNGLTINTKDLAIDSGNKRVIEKLYNHYDSWQKDWREKLTVEPGSEEEAAAEEMPTDNTAMAAGPGGEMGAGPGAEADETGGMPAA